MIGVETEMHKTIHSEASISLEAYIVTSGMERGHSFLLELCR